MLFRIFTAFVGHTLHTFHIWMRCHQQCDCIHEELCYWQIHEMLA